MRTAGGVRGVIGALISFVAFLLKTSVASYGGDVNNLGLLQQQMMVLHVGLSVAIVGAILFAAGAIVEALHPPPTEHRAQDAPASSSTPTVPAGSYQELTPEEIEQNKNAATIGYIIIGALIVVFLVAMLAMSSNLSSETTNAPSTSTIYATDDALMGNDVTSVDATPPAR